MRLLIEMSHPADVNFFRHALRILSETGWEYEVVTRGRENALDVLGAYEFKATIYGKTAPGLAARAFQTLSNDVNILRIARRFRPDVFLSFGSAYMCQVARFMGKKSIVFTDTETAGLQLKLTTPFADAIYTPAAFGLDFGGRQIRFKGFKELAYLSPKYFDPLSEPLPAGFERGKYAIIRINAFDAVHDIGLPAPLTMSDWSKIVASVERYVQPVILSELSLPPDLRVFSKKIPPLAFHSVLANAAIVVSDSCTITTESAVLGVPVVFCHPDPSQLKNFEELERRYGLIVCRRKTDGIIASIDEMFGDLPKTREGLAKKREKLLAESEDITGLIVKSVEKWSK